MPTSRTAMVAGIGDFLKRIALDALQASGSAFVR
jgi:hypothetical protein